MELSLSHSVSDIAIDKNSLPLHNEEKTIEESIVADIEDFPSTGDYAKPITLKTPYPILKNIVKTMLSRNIHDRTIYESFIHEMGRKHHVSVGNAEILYTYRIYTKHENIPYDKSMESVLQTKSYRSKSGVMVITVATSPYPNGQKFSCKFRCSYCSNQEGYPRSYLGPEIRINSDGTVEIVGGEPAIERGKRLNWDPLLQFRDRGLSYIANGHPVDKCEVIVIGGTWTSYPSEYKDWFLHQLYYAANTFFDSIDHRELRGPYDLEKEMLLNETSMCRIIGLTLETRPDCITPKEITRYRKFGVTRIQVGIQHINKRLLDRVSRECAPEQTIDAIRLMKDSCYKIDAHWMPGLPEPFKKGVDPYKENVTRDDIDYDFDVYEEDIKMFETVIYGTDYSVDQWKIYPYEVVPYTKLYEEYKNGIFKSYTEEIVNNPYETRHGKKKNKKNKTPKNFTRLHELLIYVKSIIPEYIRLNRCIRDIPSPFIMGGPVDVSMRQVLQIEMKKRGLVCKCIRCKEVKDKDIDKSTAVLFCRQYESSGGREFFLSFETPDENTLFGFLRLRLSKNAGMHVRTTKKGKEVKTVVFDELIGCALIRELHVYGQVKEVNREGKNNIIGDKTQHSGFGKRLVREAFRISMNNGFKKIAVISGVGVKEYYRKFGFETEGMFMTHRFGTKEMYNHIAEIMKTTMFNRSFLSKFFANKMKIFCEKANISSDKMIIIHNKFSRDRHLDEFYAFLYLLSN